MIHPDTPCHAMPCHAMPCHAMPCHAMPCHAMPCHAMPCHAMPCHAMLQYMLIHHQNPWYALVKNTSPVSRACARPAGHTTSVVGQLAPAWGCERTPPWCVRLSPTTPCAAGSGTDAAGSWLTHCWHSAQPHPGLKQHVCVKSHVSGHMTELLWQWSRDWGTCDSGHLAELLWQWSSARATVTAVTWLRYCDSGFVTGLLWQWSHDRATVTVVTWPSYCDSGHVTEQLWQRSRD